MAHPGTGGAPQSRTKIHIKEPVLAAQENGNHIGKIKKQRANNNYPFVLLNATKKWEGAGVTTSRIV